MGIKFSIAISIILLAPAWIMNGGLTLAADGASVARGGRLFDNWILETRDRPPINEHPKYQYNQSTMHGEETSWRCSSRHGWDYKGRTDQGTSALSGEVGATPASLKAILQDSNHGYANKLSKRDMLILRPLLPTVSSTCAHA